MKKSIYYICLIAAILCLQGCPYVEPNDPENPKEQTGGMGGMQDYYIDPTVCMYILSPMDTICTYRYFREGIRIDSFPSSNYVVQHCWLEPIGEKHDEKLHELHFKKNTNYDDAIVIECPALYINDEFWSFQSYEDPADSLIIHQTELGADTTIRHRKAPIYDLQAVINELELNYPQYIHRISDTLMHHLRNNGVSGYGAVFPKIYLP